MSLLPYILISLFQFLLLLAAIYWITRLKENAKNKSLLEHISDLTQKTQEVKKGFNEDLERVRQQLGALTNRQNLLFEESKNSIIEFLSNISSWYYNLNPGIHEYNLVNFETIDERLRLMSQDYQSVVISSSRLQLFVDDNELVDTSNEAFLSYMHVHIYVESSTI